MKIYVAGPMRGYPEYNFPAFDYAARVLRQAGHDVVSPAELDRSVGVHEFSTNLPPGFMRDAMKRDLPVICDSDALVLLPGWEQSSGTAVEKHLAELLGLEIFSSDQPEDDRPLVEYMQDILTIMEAVTV